MLKPLGMQLLLFKRQLLMSDCFVGSPIADPASFVLPFIGTSNGGHVFPGNPISSP
jgi:hypothetical protein